jgi:hypothetical protein
MRGKWSKQGSCDGKQAFESARLAHEVVKARMGTKRRGQPKRHPMKAYRCDHCGSYHICTSRPASAANWRKREAGE